jgi:glycosyltransferase involved in cell wall biosynthesis
MRELVVGPRRNLVVVLTTPPLLAAAGAVARAIRRTPYGVWSMDLHPDAEFGLKMLEPAGITGRLLRAVDEWSLKRADIVVDLGRYMKERLVRKGVPASRLTTIPVWSSVDDFDSMTPAENPLRARLGLADSFVVMYSGNAGLAHRFDEVLDAAELLRDDPAISFLFVGDGPRRKEIEARVRSSGLDNVRYLDYFPREDLRQSLALGDVHLLTLRSEMAGIAVPGKLYGIMAAGRPVVMVGPTASEPAETILLEGIGMVVDPDAGGDGEAVAAAIRHYRDDSEARLAAGQRARQAFLDKYERETACAAWEELLLKVTAEAR